jgi:hypothetical protein
MSKKAYKYCHVQSSNDRPSDRSLIDTHSEVITLYDTEEMELEKVAIIHDELHFGGKVDGIQDTYPYPEDRCPCKGGEPPVRAWDGNRVLVIPFEKWSGDPEIPVLYLD